MFFTACNDSSAPTSLDASSALESLAIGLTQLNEAGKPVPSGLKTSFDAISSQLDRVSVTVDGVPQRMYGLSIRETFPAGTCVETIDSSLPGLPGVCTPLKTGITTLLWQTRSPSKAPDKLIMIISDIGSSEFDHSTVTITLPSNGSPEIAPLLFDAFAMYVTGGKLFGAKSGTITTGMTSSESTCDSPLPPYVKAQTCHLATFTLSGTIGMGEFATQGPTARTLSLRIPSIVMDGLWIDITSVQPITLSTDRSGASTRK